MTYSIPKSPNVAIPPQPDVQHLEVGRGSDYAFVYSYKNPLTGLPINLTGYTATFTVVSRSSPGSPAVITKANGLGIVINAVAGTLSISLNSSEMLNLDDSSFGYDLIISDPSGLKTKILQGFVTIVDTVG